MCIDLSEFGIIGQSAPMLHLAEWVRAAAPHWDTILITGERGTGKELLSRAIHKFGPTHDKKTVVVDCAALHPETVESVLFGHEKGAFTGANDRRIGYLEKANGSTIFLDEIGVLPLEVQGRLLRFLEERTVTRLGSTEPIHVRTRVVAATNRDIAKDAQNGFFLPDLYDRLGVLRARIPPLRKRKGDVFLLLNHFISAKAAERFTRDARIGIERYAFPGNVRELRNLCRRLEIFHPQGRIGKIALERLLEIRRNESF